MIQNNESTLFQRYLEEIKEDLKIDDFNVKESQRLLPGIKHKWISRLIQQRFELNKLKKLREEALEKICKQLHNEQIVQLSEKTLNNQAMTHEVIKKIDAEITNSLIIIEYLEKMEKVFSQVTFDIRNLIELQKQELS